MVISILHSIEFWQEGASAFLFTVLYEHLCTINTQNFLMLLCHLITSSHYNINWSKGHFVLLCFKLLYWTLQGLKMWGWEKLQYFFDFQILGIKHFNWTQIENCLMKSVMKNVVWNIRCHLANVPVNCRSNELSRVLDFSLFNVLLLYWGYVWKLHWLIKT